MSHIDCPCWATGEFKQVPCWAHDGHGLYPKGAYARSQMTDLKNLTPEELLDITEYVNIPPRNHNRFMARLAEIRRRLEELETTKEDLIAQANAACDMRQRLQYLEGLYFEVEGIRDDGTLGPIDKQLLERLEKYAAALRKARTLLISEGDPDEDGEMIAEIDELIGGCDECNEKTVGYIRADIAAEAVAAERERCAKIAESYFSTDLREIAAQIREGSMTTPLDTNGDTVQNNEH